MLSELYCNPRKNKKRIVKTKHTFTSHKTYTAQNFA
jgi:hypothetical protein